MTGSPNPKWFKIVGGIAHLFDRSVTYQGQIRSRCGLMKFPAFLDIPEDDTPKCRNCSR